MAHRYIDVSEREILEKKESPPQLYELIIYDNKQRRVAGDGQPHLILKRSIPGAAKPGSLSGEEQDASSADVDTYIASLSHHVPSDVHRVVEAIIAEEEAFGDDHLELQFKKENEELNNIFRSLRKVRSRVVQKNYKYRNKVEYEDR